MNAGGLHGRVVAVTPNPAVDRTVEVDGFRLGDVNRARSSRDQAGGKGVNVASALADAGVPVVASGLLGEDNAAIFESFLLAKGIGDRFVRVEGATRVGLKIVDAISREVTELNFPGLAPAEDDLERLRHALLAEVTTGAWCVLAGSLPPGAPPSLHASLVRAVRERGAHVALDTSGEALRLALDEAPDLAKPNLAELEQLVGRSLPELPNVAEAAEAILARGVRLVVVSLGARGALFVRSGERLLAKAPSVEARSTVGAGDTLVAGLVLAQLRGLDLEAAARLATAFGAHAVTRVESGVDLEAVRELSVRVVLERI